MSFHELSNWCVYRQPFLITTDMSLSERQLRGVFLRDTTDMSVSESNN